MSYKNRTSLRAVDTRRGQAGAAAARSAAAKWSVVERTIGQDIRQVAVIGAGTMGTGIAALSADAGLDVVLLDVDRARAEAALARILEGRPPMLDDPQSARHIRLAVFPDEIATIRDANWVL
jgi:threonine dehydrogenase-like Zn-dependent dehydrogenase